MSKINFGNLTDDFDDFGDELSVPSGDISAPEYIPDEDYNDADITESVITNAGFRGMSDEDRKCLEIYGKAVDFEIAFSEMSGEPVPEKEKVTEEEIEYTSDVKEQEEEEKIEKKEALQKLFLGAFSWLVEKTNEGVELAENISSDKNAVRKYNKKAEMPKITYAKARGETPFLKKLIIFLIICTGIGIMFGAEANSYMAFHYAEKPTPMGCSFGWIAEFDSLPFNISRFYGNVFFTGFMLGFGILGIIGLFIYLDSEQKKASRVGKEHGSAHIAKNRDYKIYKNKFME